MPTILRVNNQPTKPLSNKHMAKVRRRTVIEKTANNIILSEHSEKRIEERIERKSRVKEDIINSILRGRVKQCIRYKIKGDFGTYVLSDNGTLITAMTNDIDTNNFSKIDDYHLKNLKRLLKISGK